MNPPLTIAAVGYLNTAPLLEGLDTWSDASLVRAVPSNIAPMVLSGEADIGLVSIVDYAHAQGTLSLLNCGMIGSAGETLTVRLFSSVPIEHITTVHADTDSHTSVVLCDLILRERYGVDASFVDYDYREQAPVREGASESPWPSAALMIGDKVVTGHAPAVRYPHQIDLGQAWHQMTGLPFVYAAWMCLSERRNDPAVINAAQVIERTRRRNTMRLDKIVTDAAAKSGWPSDLARRYIGELLRFEPDERARDGAARFLSAAAERELLPKIEPNWINIGQDGLACPR